MDSSSINDIVHVAVIAPPPLPVAFRSVSRQVHSPFGGMFQTIRRTGSRRPQLNFMAAISLISGKKNLTRDRMKRFKFFFGYLALRWLKTHYLSHITQSRYVY